MAYTLSTFNVQGVKFKLKPTSPRNMMHLQNYVDESVEINEDAEEGDTDYIQATAEQYMEILKLIAYPEEGSFDDIDPMDIDVNKIDYYLGDFMPAGTAT